MNPTDDSTETPVDAALEVAFGDEARDPGPVIQALRADPAALKALREARETLDAVRTATRPSSAGDGLRRLDALIEEAARPASSAALISPETASASPAIARARARWFGVALIAAAAAVLLTLRLWPSPQPASHAPGPVALTEARGDVSLGALQALAEDAASSGMGFAGTALTPAARGYLFGMARDAQLAAATAGGDRARALAVDALDRIVRDLEPAVPPADVAARGCPALYPEGTARVVCQHGVTLYRLKRDLGTELGDRLLRAPQASAAAAWAATLALPELADVSLPQASTGPITAAERAAWGAFLAKVRSVLEARLE